MDESLIASVQSGISYQAWWDYWAQVRHKGFYSLGMTDVGSMFREDYEIFGEAPQAGYDQIFAFKTAGRGEYFPAVNTNLSLKGTVCVPIEFLMPLYVVLFLLAFSFDKIPADPKKLAS